METSKNWDEFYAIRVNSSYQDYFEKRYDVINSFNPRVVREEGIGIGSVSKAINKTKEIFTYGFDNNKRVLKLCEENTPETYTYYDCIVNTDKSAYKSIKTDLVVTHGVLEHFSDYNIKKIINRHRSENIKTVHYVPLNKYVKPSFGDKRLLPYEHWLDLVQPKDFLLFNDNHDLLLIN